MNEKGNLEKFELTNEEENKTILKRVALFLLTIVLIVIGVRWLISFCLELLVPESN
jgi:hypothetical protein